MPTTHSLRFVISIFALSFVLLFAMAILPVNAQEVEDDRQSPGGDKVTDEEPKEEGEEEMTMASASLPASRKIIMALQ